MKNLKLTKREIKQIEEGIQVEKEFYGFYIFINKDEYGDFHTPSGVRFSIGFFSPTHYDITINGENQVPTISDLFE